jgi:hypothetical protein
MSGAGVVRPGWEYKYVQQRREAELFKRTVSDHGAAGWEYCDHLELGRAAAPRGDEATDLLVFKRPAGGAGWVGGGAGLMGAGGSFPANPGAVPMGAPGGLSRGVTGGSSGAGGAGGGGSNGFGNPANPLRPGMGPGGSGTGKAGPAGAGDETLVLRAKYARAEELVTTLRGVFARDGVDLTADERTNSVIVRGDARAIDRVRALLAELDTPAAETRPPAPKR